MLQFSFLYDHKYLLSYIGICLLSTSSVVSTLCLYARVLRDTVTQKNKILSNLNTTQKKSNVDVNFAIHRTDLGAHCKKITLVNKKRENKSMLLQKLFEIDTSQNIC